MDVGANFACESPKIDDSTPEVEMKRPKDKLLEILDNLETHIESFRKEILRLEDKRDTLFTSLDAIRHSDWVTELLEDEREDIHRHMERLTSRCLTVEIFVKTDRDSEQEEALFQVNRLIDSLVVDYRNDPIQTRMKCLSFMASCCKQPQNPIDKVFENALIGCTLDDRKKIKKRLQGLYSYMENDGKIILLPPM